MIFSIVRYYQGLVNSWHGLHDDVDHSSYSESLHQIHRHLWMVHEYTLYLSPTNKQRNRYMYRIPYISNKITVLYWIWEASFSARVHRWNQCLSPLTSWVLIPLTLCDKVCQWLAADRCIFLGVFRVPPPIKTDRRDMTDILLKVNTITLKEIAITELQ